MTNPNDLSFTRSHWRKSSHSTGVNECVEVAGMGSAVAVRDSKNPGAGHLIFAAAEWKVFLRSVKSGSHDQ